MADWLQPNQAYSRHYMVANDNVNPLHVRLALGAVVTAPDWTYALVVGPFSADTLDITVPAGGSKAFDVEIQTGATQGSIKLSLFGQNLDDQYGYGFGQGYFGIVPEGEILFVDDDGGEGFEEAYYAFFDSAGVAFTSMTEPDLLPWRLESTRHCSRPFSGMSHGDSRHSRPRTSSS